MTCSSASLSSIPASPAVTENAYCLQRLSQTTGGWVLPKENIVISVCINRNLQESLLIYPGCHWYPCVSKDSSDRGGNTGRSKIAEKSSKCRFISREQFVGMRVCMRRDKPRQQLYRSQSVTWVLSYLPKNRRTPLIHLILPATAYVRAESGTRWWSDGNIVHIGTLQIQWHQDQSHRNDVQGCEYKVKYRQNSRKNIADSFD